MYDSDTGQIVENNAGSLAYVPFTDRLRVWPEHLIFVSPTLVVIWVDESILVNTRYPDGKTYRFFILDDGRVIYTNW